MVNQSSQDAAGSFLGGITSRWMARSARHFRQPHGLFQIAGMAAVLAIFIGHLRDQPADELGSAPLTMASQDLPGRLIGELIGDPAFSSGISMAVLMFSTYAVALLLATSSRHPSMRNVVVLVTIQLLIGTFYSNDLLLVLAAQYPIVFGTRRALRWLALQSAGMAGVWGLIATMGSHRPLGQVGASLLIFGAWQLFAFSLGYVAMRERRNHDRLTATNAQLLAAQQLLAENARSSERLRMARELHDGLGHHMTALGLHLELAAHQAPGAQSSSVRTAREIARTLLQELRSAVSEQRSVAPIDLEQSLRTMCAGVPTIDVRFQYARDCAIDDPALAHTVFRCVQEALSNALRHADARTLSVAVNRDAAGICVDVEDDGRGAGRVVYGNGLRGMRERVEARGGKVEVNVDNRTGFRISIWLPQQRSEP